MLRDASANDIVDTDAGSCTSANLMRQSLLQVVGRLGASGRRAPRRWTESLVRCLERRSRVAMTRDLPMTVEPLARRGREYDVAAAPPRSPARARATHPPENPSCN